MATADRTASTHVTYETARLALARVNLEGLTTRTTAARQAAKICSDALNVERVSVWLFDSSNERLMCQTLYVRSENRHTSGKVLLPSTFPTYCKALTERRAIVADNALSYELTHELAETYLKPLGITSMLDAGIFQEGRVVGVVCNEHVGPARNWTQAEVDFAASVADMMSTIVRQCDQLEIKEEALERAARLSAEQKLEVLELLAGGLAHDFNNILLAVSSAASEIEKDLPDETVAGVLRRCADVGSGLVGRLLSFVKRREPATGGGGQLSEVVRRLEPVLETLLRARAKLEVVEQTQACVAVPTEQLEQIVLNLCLNARDAMKTQYGHVRIEVREIGGEVLLEVSDNGCGMDDHTKKRIWDAYFTTKENGAGLGLATVHAITEAHGGRVEVESTPGNGSVFRVFLPKQQQSKA
jgi:signal transduction histidine kinase